MGARGVGGGDFVESCRFSKAWKELSLRVLAIDRPSKSHQMAHQDYCEREENRVEEAIFHVPQWSSSFYSSLALELQCQLRTRSTAYSG